MKAGHDIAACLGFFWLVSQQRQPLGRQAQQAQQLRQWGGGGGTQGDAAA